MGLLETQFLTCLRLKTMHGFPENASENGKPGAKIKGSNDKKSLKARSPNFPLLQIWLRLHHFMTMTEEQTLVMFFWPSGVRYLFFGFCTKNVFAPKKIIIIVEKHEFSVFMPKKHLRAKKLWENKLVKTHEFFIFTRQKSLHAKKVKKKKIVKTHGLYLISSFGSRFIT